MQLKFKKWGVEDENWIKQEWSCSKKHQVDEEDIDWEWALLLVHNVFSSTSRAAMSRNCNTLGSKVLVISCVGIYPWDV